METKGYTGQTKISKRSLKYTLDEYKDFMRRMDACIETNLKGLGAFETTQFYRGTLFVALDLIMDLDHVDETARLISIDFIKKCLDLIN